ARLEGDLALARAARVPDARENLGAPLAGRPDGHEISDDEHAARFDAECRDENVRAREVAVLGGCRDRGRDAPPPTAGVVEHGGEHAGRIEARRAQPVDRAVGPDYRRGVQVADYAVVAHGEVWHRADILRTPEAGDQRC